MYARKLKKILRGPGTAAFNGDWSVHQISFTEFRLDTVNGTEMFKGTWEQLLMQLGGMQNIDPDNPTWVDYNFRAEPITRRPF